MEWVWIIAGWLFLNVIIKLIINSVERLYKDDIDKIVRLSVSKIKYFPPEIIRISLIIFLLPNILISKTLFELFPSLLKHPFFKEYKSFNDSVLSKDRFRRDYPYIIYMVRHPVMLFSKSKEKMFRERWLEQILEKKSIPDRDSSK